MPSIIYWPENWAPDIFRACCIVPGCPFVVFEANLSEQWTRIHEHCLDTRGPEHDLLDIMLVQRRCAIVGCNYGSGTGSKSYMVRALFRHERSAHNSQTMSDFCSFVVLARQGLIRALVPERGWVIEPNCRRLAYDRMLDKMGHLLCPTNQMLFQKSGYSNPDLHTRENLGKILTQSPLTETTPDEDVPYWMPVPAHSFLSHCRPDETDPEFDLWLMIWCELREKYADGRI